MPVLNVADLQIAVDTVKTTDFALGIKDASGAVYYAPMSVGSCPDSLKVQKDGLTYTIGQSTLYHEVTSVNSCEEIELRPGCYTVELMGARGGDGGGNLDSGQLATLQTYSFTIDVTTVAYAFRGGDGNSGTVNSSSSGVFAAGGGGASGGPSLFQIGTDFVLSNGGDGGLGAGGYNSSAEEQECGSGGGGSATQGADGLTAMGGDSWWADGLGCGAGGGGAIGGATGEAASGTLYRGNAGTAATESGGGNGGNSSIGGLFGSSSGTGGIGGANTSWVCGTQTIYSYGGGGGGAVSTGGLFGVGVGVNGGDGGSGVLDTSDTSYVRIYRF